MEIETLRDLLSIKLNSADNPVLKEQLSDAERWQVAISLAYRGAEETLSLKKSKSISSASSEDRRKVDLAGKCAAEQREVDELGDLARIIQTRISLGQSLLR